MAGRATQRGQRGPHQASVDQPGPVWGRRLAIVLVVVVAALAASRPAPTAARPPEAAAGWTHAGHAGDLYTTDTGQHGIEQRDAPPPAPERRVGRAFDALPQFGSGPVQAHPVVRVRLRLRHGAPPSRTRGGNSPRAPPGAAGAIRPLA